MLGTFLAALVAHAMEVTTPASESTTEDASGRLLSLPNVEKCAKRKFKDQVSMNNCRKILESQLMLTQIRNFNLGPINFTHDGHGYFYSGWVDEHKDDKVRTNHDV